MGPRIRVTPAGPYVVSGGVALTRGSVRVPTNEVYTLCRCGRSARPPFCDRTHARTGYAAPDDGGSAPPAPTGLPDEPGIDVRDGGPLVVSAGVAVERGDGTVLAVAGARLCRCGATPVPPFCDGSGPTCD